MTWTTVNKPGAQTWDTANPAGKEMYDQFDLIYDDVDVYYDGANPDMWTDVAKPVFSLTWDQAVFSWDSFDNPWESPSWGIVSKPV